MTQTSGGNKNQRRPHAQPATKTNGTNGQTDEWTKGGTICSHMALTVRWTTFRFKSTAWSLKLDVSPSDPRWHPRSYTPPGARNLRLPGSPLRGQWEVHEDPKTPHRPSKGHFGLHLIFEKVHGRSQGPQRIRGPDPPLFQPSLSIVKIISKAIIF